MISKIDVKKFGLFQDYLWDKSIGKDNNFKRVNIIYGRNYSGKTTIARILNCIDKKEIHPKYVGSEFTILFNDGNIVDETNIASHQLDFKIRVYNTDFVKDNLSWLHDDDGTIKPFTILGAKNIELEMQIKEIEQKLGAEELKQGALFALSESVYKYAERRTTFESKKNKLDLSLKDKAKEIKNRANIYNVPVYQINTIKTDIHNVTDSSILSEEKIEELKKLLKEEPKKQLAKIPKYQPAFSNMFSATKEITNRRIVPSDPIQELVEDALLQEWVRQGIDKHKGKRTICGFCGNILSSDLWNKLGAHFNKESEDLRENIKTQILFLENQKKQFSQLITLEKENFYSNYIPTYEKLIKCWENSIVFYSNNIDRLIDKLNKREKDIFKEFTLNEIDDNSNEILNIIKEFNKLIEDNNNKTLTLSKDQEKARDELRLSFVAKYKKDINFNRIMQEIEALETEVIELENIKKKKEEEVNILLEQKRVLEAQAKDESRGAELVNQHLSRFFGHEDLKLVAEGNAPNMRFKITRDKCDANNLSEGECSLISFCYFIARMEDELKDDINNKKLIIFIDDPISSLDGNHIFFVFSLIESIIAKPKIYCQLFLSTHNLDFLKYLKRLTIPDTKENAAYYLVERRQRKNDKKILLLLMPKHIKDYVTEFHYLFNEIYKVYKEVSGDKKTKIENTYNQFYNLPNNIRKFLECYLFYKYPNNDNPLENLGKLFNENIPCLINRIINEYSHLTYIDRGWKPIDVDEAEECARIIIEKLKEKDLDQFNALLQSIRI